ncbi:MAG: type II toxin-antitoxin system RelE/ParE family toxin [Anaerolineales bacterium]|nr:type II toxin-antitoxin system RelE/ParE family toxin [Anaerolineales bacterium]NUQ84006.1 type II toxin-antitoxin system RelE/ParE family toxin [Anaerolineales bacterium]
MKVEFKSSFVRDLKKVKEKQLQNQVLQIIGKVEKSAVISEIEQLKKLRGGDVYYRIRLGDYRIGLKVENDKVYFIRFLHRKDIYRYFP